MPTPREQLSEAMRKARLEAGFDTHAKLAKRMHTSRPAISRAESANQPVPSEALLAAWAGTCGVPVEEFTEIVARAKSGTPEWFAPWLDAEAAATRLQFYAPTVVPGLLQKESYIRALEKSGDAVKVRLERQQVIGKARITAVIDHRVLAHAIGSPAVMAEQLRHLAELAESEMIGLHIVPEGTDIGLGGAVAIASRSGTVMISMGTFTRDITSTAPDVVDATLGTFDAILGASLPVVQSVEYTRRMEEIWKER